MDTALLLGRTSSSGLGCLEYQRLGGGAGDVVEVLAEVEAEISL